MALTCPRMRAARLLRIAAVVPRFAGTRAAWDFNAGNNFGRNWHKSIFKLPTEAWNGEKKNIRGVNATGMIHGERRPVGIAGLHVQVDSPNEEIRVERLGGGDAGIVVMSLNRPNAKNAIGKRFVQCLRELVSDLRRDDSSRILIIKSLTDGVFCAGADLKERKGMTPREVGAFASDLQSTLDSLSNLRIPTICAVEGFALGGGFELCLACDIIVADETAIFGFPETKLAIIPGAGGTQRISRLIGPSKAKEIIFSAKRMDAKYSESLGIVNHCVEKGKAFEKATQIARDILPQGPLAIKMAKAAINHGFETDMTTGLAIERACYAQLLHTQDRLEGINAFLERRDPSYKGE